jgi:hypothetical protein
MCTVEVSGILRIHRTVALVVVPQGVCRMSRVERNLDFEATIKVCLPVRASAFRHLFRGDRREVGCQSNE